MTLKSKSQLFLGIVLLSLLLLLDVIFSQFLITSAEQVDRERISRDLSRATVTLKGEARTLSALAGNWAYSDKSWDYMRGNNPDYPHAYLNRSVLTEIGVSSMIFLNNDCNVKLFRDYSAPDDQSTPESEYNALFTQNKKDFLANLPEDGTSGIVMKGSEPILFSVKRIMRSDQKGESAGYLIMTMAMSQKMISNIARNLQFNFSVEPIDQAKVRSVLPKTVIDTNPGKSFISGHILVRDHAGNPAFWISGISSKVDIKAADKKLQRLFLTLALCALVIIFIFGIFMKYQVTNRMRLLQKEIETIRDETVNVRKITIDRKRDEIGSMQRTLNDCMAFFDFKQGEKAWADDITIAVYKRFSDAGRRLCTKTLEDIATAFSPGDENFRAALVRCATKARGFAEKLGLHEEELIYVYSGALFSRIGMLALPFSLRNKTSRLTPQEERDLKKYPIRSKDFLEQVELLRPASPLVYSWNENWDGSGFPQGLSGSSIPLSARLFAIVDAWNEMTRKWPGRKLPSHEEVLLRLRAMEGTRLDPQLTEQFITFIEKETNKDD